MKKSLIFAILMALMMVALPVSAQTMVKGHVVNERGERVEYVSIGFEEDSVGTISDANGNFCKDTSMMILFEKSPYIH